MLTLLLKTTKDHHEAFTNPPLDAMKHQKLLLSDVPDSVVTFVFVSLNILIGIHFILMYSTGVDEIIFKSVLFYVPIEIHVYIPVIQVYFLLTC